MTHVAIKNAFDEGNGVLRLTPTWVPRSFCIPGDPSESLALHLIPVLNVIFSLKAIILSQTSVAALLLTLGSNLVFIAVLTLLTSRLYNTERILAKS